jgi:hypothetical protein
MAGSANSGQRKDKQIREALMVAANRIDENDPQSRKKLYVAAAKVVEMAVQGDLAAFREMADRIDGKAPQSLDVTTKHDRSIGELTAAELGAEIARIKAALALGGGAEEAGGPVGSDLVH